LMARSTRCKMLVLDELLFDIVGMGGRPVYAPRGTVSRTHAKE
jgi:hypothetical protein